MSPSSISSGFFFRIFLFLVLTWIFPATPGFTETDTTFAVEFRLNMSKATSQNIFDPAKDMVYVVADHGMSPLQLVEGPKYVYTGIIPNGLDSGQVYQYRFRINADTYETVNRSFTAAPGTTTLYAWWNDDPANKTTFRVNMEHAWLNGAFDPDSDSVCMVGSMNRFLGSPGMQREGNGFWYNYTYVLEPGDIHRYKYRINADSSGMELSGQPDRMFYVPDTLATVSFDFNNDNPARKVMTFRCNLSYYISTGQFAPGSQYINVAGNFNGWGGNDVLFDVDGDSVYTLDLMLDTTWFRTGPLQFKFRIDGNPANSELIGKPDRTYAFHDPVNLNPNIFSCFFNDLNPSVSTPPRAYDLMIQGNLVINKNLTGVYSYENINGIPEGKSVYRWLRSDNAEGLNAVAIDSATRINYVVDTLDIGKFLVFEVTPVGMYGDSATGKPVRVVTTGTISEWDLGIDEWQTVLVHLFPNPADAYVNVAIDGKISRAEVVNMLNQVVMTCENPGGSSCVFQTGGLLRGIYFIRVIPEKGRPGVARLMKR